MRASWAERTLWTLSAVCVLGCTGGSSSSSPVGDGGISPVGDGGISPVGDGGTDSPGNVSLVSDWIQWPATAGGNDHWYGVYRTPTDWTTADAAIGGSGAYLVTITDAGEQQFITDTFFTGDDALRVFWIGA